MADITRDRPTVNPDGSRREGLPDGAELRRLVTHPDERGTVTELLDERWGVAAGAPMVFAYACTIRPGWAKGWAVHHHHEDRYTLLQGEVEIVLHDGREDTATAGRTSRIVLSHFDRSLLVIPRGVWHAERNIGETDVVIVNFPTSPYDHEHPDKYRLPLDSDALPVELGPEWRGW